MEARLTALEDEKLAEAERHTREMRTLESDLNAAHAGKQVSTQQHIAHCMFMEAHQTEIWLWYEERQHQCACLLLLGTNVDGTGLEVCAAAYNTAAALSI